MNLIWMGFFSIIINQDGPGNASAKDFCGIMKLSEKEIRQELKL